MAGCGASVTDIIMAEKKDLNLMVGSIYLRVKILVPLLLPSWALGTSICICELSFASRKGRPYALGHWPSLSHKVTHKLISFLPLNKLPVIS